MLRLGPEWVTYYCSSEVFLKEPNGPEARFIEKLINANIEIVFDNYEKALSHPAILMDGWYIGGRSSDPLLTAIQQSGMKIVCYNHGTDTISHPEEGLFVLFSSDMQFFSSIGSGQYMLDRHGLPVWGKSPQGGEGALAGLMHLGEWISKRKTPKAALKAELAGTMRVEFDPELPLLVYYTNQLCIGREMDEGLMRLSEHANIVIKTLAHWTTRAEGKNIHIIDGNFDSFLPRFAADYVLAGDCSAGTLTTSIMLGLRAIPVFSQYSDRLGLGGWDIPEHKRYQDWVRSGQPPRFVHHAKYINTHYAAIWRHIKPHDIMDTEILVRRIHDSEYWKTYDSGILRIRRNIFGACPLKGHIRAANHIKNILGQGTLLRKNIADLNIARQGPLSVPQKKIKNLHEFPTAIQRGLLMLYEPFLWCFSARRHYDRYKKDPSDFFARARSKPNRLLRFLLCRLGPAPYRH